MQFNEELVKEYHSFLKSMSGKVYSLNSADCYIDREDVYSLLLEYLWEATKKFDQGRGASFKSFLNMYIGCRIKNIRRGVARRNTKGTTFIEDSATEQKNDLEISVYSSEMLVELNYDFEALSNKFSLLDKQIIDSVLLDKIDLKDYAKMHNISYSKAYRNFNEVKDKIIKIIE